LLGYFHSPANPVYFLLIFSALIFSLIGDVFLALPPKYLMSGIALFLIVHILYLAAFSTSFRQNTLMIIPGSILLSASYVYFNKIKKHLKELKIPVIVYIVIINLMVISAFSSLTDKNTSVVKAALVVTGALLFYISDMFVAWDRFVKPFRIHYFEYILYYAAQQILALSVIYA
jgi:uncharacterized membrane protein YhhN